MEINMEVKFKDGTVINLTESQYRELKSTKIKVHQKTKYNFDYFRSNIPERIAKNGNTTEARLFNLYRDCDRGELNRAIRSLCDDGVIKINEHVHKYNKAQVFELSLM